MKKVFLSVVFGVGLLLNGCQTQEEVLVQTVQAEPEETVLEFYTWHDERQYMMEMSDAFMKEYPEIKVNLHCIPASEYGQTLSILHNKEESRIDLFAEAKPSAASVDIQKGYALDLTEMMKIPDSESTSYEELKEELRVDHKIYMLPYRKSTWAVYYNKEMFDQKGISYPEGPWTWTDYTQLARALTGFQESKKVYGSLCYDSTSTWWRVPVRSEGIENQITEKGLERLKETALWNYQMSYQYQCQPAFTELVGASSYDYVTRFLNEDAAMFYCGDWCMEMIARQLKERNMEFSYDVAPMPGPEEGPAYTPVTAAVVLLSSKTRYPEEALLFAEFISGERGAEILAANGVIPAYDSEKIHTVLKENPYAPEHMEVFFQYDHPVYTLPDSSVDEAMEVVNRYVQQYFLKEISLDQAFLSAEEILRERGLIQDDETEN